MTHVSAEVPQEISQLSRWHGGGRGVLPKMSLGPGNTQ